MVKALTSKQLDISINSLKKKISKLLEQKKKTIARERVAAKKKVVRKPTKKPVRKIAKKAVKKVVKKTTKKTVKKAVKKAAVKKRK